MTIQAKAAGAGAYVLAKAGSVFASLVLRLVLIVAVVAMWFNTYADIRVELPLLPDIHLEGWKPKAKRLGADLEAMIEAQAGAASAQRAVNDRAEQAYRDRAKESDDEKKQFDGAVRDATDRYVSAHRVRPEAACRAPGGSDPAAEDRDPGMAGALPGVADVVISESDLRQLTDAAGYAVACHNWALSLVRPVN